MKKLLIITLFSLIGMACFVFGQIDGSLGDPVASAKVIAEQLERQIKDQEIESDIDLRDNQTAQRIDKSIAELEKIYKLLDATYNKTDELAQHQDVKDFINTQRETSSQIIRLVSGLKFGKEFISLENAEAIMQTIQIARQNNFKAWKICEEVLKPTNNMTVGERMQIISDAERKNDEANFLIESAFAQIHNIDVLQTQRENSKKLVSLINIY